LDAEDLVFDHTTEQLKQLSLNVDGLSGGERKVGVRVKDDQGNWSSVSYVDIYMIDLTTVEADEVADAQINRVSIDNLPSVGTSVSVDLNGTGYTYQVKAGDDLNAVRNGLMEALKNNPLSSAHLLPGGIIELRGKQTDSSYIVNSSVGSVQGGGTGAVFPNGAQVLTERTLVEAEYFIDSDPGEGNGTSLDAEDLVFDQITEQLKQLSLNVDGLSGGERRVGVRVKDDQGNWSTVSYVDLYMIDLTTVEADEVADTQVEGININSLPAVGANVSVSLNGTAYTYQTQAGDDLNTVRNGLLSVLLGNPIASASSLPGGIIELRGKQANGNYSLSSNVGSVQSVGSGAMLPNGAGELVERRVVEAEYFIETDPGEGNAFAVDAEDLVYDQTTEQLKQLSLNVDGLSGGEHRVGIRVKDDLGNWATTSFVDLYMVDLTTVEADEPAVAQVDRINISSLPAVGSSVSVSLNGSVYSYETKAGDDLNTVRNGLLGALVSNPFAYTKILSNGQLELTGRQPGDSYNVDLSQVGVIVPAVEAEPEFLLGIEEKDEAFLAGAEYFIETDPGEGNGTILDPEDLEFDQTDEGIASLNLTVYDFPPGNRRVGIRFKDANESWSSVRYVDVEAEDAGDYTPSGVRVTPSKIIENASPGTWQGVLSTIDWDDPDGNGTYQYQLVVDSSTNNALFSLSGNILTTHQVFDYEKDEPLRLSIKTTDVTNRSVVASVILPIEDDLMEDGDGDGLTQAGEELAGTQDDNPDTDGDGYSDGLEVSEGSNPLSVYSQPNRSPVDLELDPEIVEENLAVGTIVTQLVPDDPDDPQVLDNYTYQFIQGAGGENNHMFSIESNGSLRSLAPLDYEANASLNLLIRVVDTGGKAVTQGVVLTLIDDEAEDADGDGLNELAEQIAGTSDLLSDTDGDGYSDPAEMSAGTDPLNAQSSPNNLPTNLRSDGLLTIEENKVAGTVVGSFLGDDADGHSLSYQLMTGAGAVHNSLFILEQNGTLKTARAFDYESDPGKLFIRVQVMDQVGGSMEGTFEVVLSDLVENQSPGNLESLSELSIIEMSPEGTSIGGLSASDPDGDILSFSLVSGVGSEGNKYFNLEQNGTLVSKEVLNISEHGSKLSIRVRVLDTKGAYVENVFEVLVKEKTYQPVLVGPIQLSIQENTTGLVAEFSMDGADPKKVYYFLLDGPDAQLFSMNSVTGELSFLILPDYENPMSVSGTNEYTIRISVIDETVSLYKVLKISILDQVENIEEKESDNTNDPETIDPGEKEIDQTVESIAGKENKDKVDALPGKDEKVGAPFVQRPLPLTLPIAIEGNLVTARAEILSYGNENPFRVGFLISEDILFEQVNPAISVIEGVRIGDKFSAKLDSFKIGTTYFVKAYAENSAGLQYGSVRKFRIEEDYEAPFDGVYAGGKWYISSWFGSFMRTEHNWIFHPELGWLYHGPVNAKGSWFWNEKLGWMWTRNDIWPHIWKNNQGGWVYYYGINRMEPLFWDYQTKRIIR